MKKIYFVAVFIVVLFSCQHTVKRDDLTKINGYWEIQKVAFPDGQEKQYTINETIDFFEWKDEKGFRKKLKPQFDGTFVVNNEQEQIEIKDSAGVMYIYYTTKFDAWKEELNLLSDSILILKNKDNLTYHYKRFIPFSIK
ncbi:hypothetical protein [Flavobacterium sp.]|uniref:hypothetical protein n=1 Tax=Flavobacterium sp. TaxID=239 RepID=UPI002619199C|nr:hypothetical protein [Flavobacterium sp.]MDD2986339.1 hypothetical protein [Flavobacterium sp.]